jgi:KUP system potassium uptake protein
MGHKQSKVTAATLLIALGIIYGDIGTSPLYVMKAIVGTREISEMLVYGAISCVFWTLMFQTTIKYIILTLQADNHGEGGIFSLYALVRKFGKGKLVIPTILGATTLLADGIITPPISVCSAVEGLEKLVPDLPTIPIVIIIISLIFFFQQFGTHKVGGSFGPIMVIWFGMLFVLGIFQILSTRILAPRWCIFMYDGSRSIIFRFRALWTQQYQNYLGICQNVFDDQLPRSSSLVIK